MALDSALHYLDELKDKYMHEVEKAIDDWDYQDFSPDKRTPLLENEISGDTPADLAPELNAKQQIKDAATLDWSGLSRDQMLADQVFGRRPSANAAGVSYEARVVAMATSSGGVQGIPDGDALKRFLQHAPAMNPQTLADALCSRLQHSTWQIRAKTLVLMEILLESPELAKDHLPVFQSNAGLLQLVDKIRTQDRNAIARENARRVLSLVRSNGTDATLVAREHVAVKPHVRHSPTPKKKEGLPPKAKPTVETTKKSNTKSLPTSPKIAAAALASHRRRSQKELELSEGMTSEKSMVPPPAPAPAAKSPLARTSSGMLQRTGSMRSAFTFVDQSPPPQQSQQQRVSITASRTLSFR